jgi:hypothetical protein
VTPDQEHVERVVTGIERTRTALRGALVGVVFMMIGGAVLVVNRCHQETALRALEPLKPPAERLTTYCMELRFDTEMVMREAGRTKQSAELVLLDWPAIATADWRSLRPCLLAGTPVAPACYPGELSCAREQAWFAHAHFEYGFLP